jgi:hypothetical protein
MNSNRRVQLKKTLLFSLSVLILSANIVAIALTIKFAFLRDMSKYTFSVVGNYFGGMHRPFYLFWSAWSAAALLVSSLFMYGAYDFTNKHMIYSSIFASYLLFVTALIPAKSQELPLLHMIHFALSLLFALIVIMCFQEYFIHVVKRKKKPRFLAFIPFMGIYFATFTLLLFFGRTGYFQIWYFAHCS